MKPQSAKPSLSVDEDSLRSTSTTASRITRASARSSSGSQVEQGCIYNMNDCYERLRAMVPDLPARRRMSKVEILQHVIDYIQDLESALELPHLQMNNFVKDPTNKTDRVPLSTISYNRWVLRKAKQMQRSPEWIDPNTQKIPENWAQCKFKKVLECLIEQQETLQWLPKLFESFKIWLLNAPIRKCPENYTWE